MRSSVILVPSRRRSWWASYKYRFAPWLVLNFVREAARQEARRSKEEWSGPEDDRRRLEELAELLAEFKRPDPEVVFR